MFCCCFRARAPVVDNTIIENNSSKNNSNKVIVKSRFYNQVLQKMIEEDNKQMKKLDNQINEINELMKRYK